MAVKIQKYNSILENGKQIKAFTNMTRNEEQNPFKEESDVSIIQKAILSDG